MDREKLKLMVRNLELLVDDIKAEVFSDVESYISPPPTISQQPCIVWIILIVWIRNSGNVCHCLFCVRCDTNQ